MIASTSEEKAISVSAALIKHGDQLLKGIKPKNFSQNQNSCMSKRKTLLLLQDILDASEKILSYTNEMSFKDFIDDDKTIEAVVWNFEIIGEAANRIPEDFKLSYVEIEWRQMIGFRNRVVHEYFEMDYENLWKIKEENVPELMELIEMLIKDLS